MSKLRRNNIYTSPNRNRNKVSNDEMNDISLSGKLKINKSKVISHGEFLSRVQKSLYYGTNKAKMSIPFSEYIADTFSETHNGYSLNRLNYSTVGNLRSTPCSLILAMIYLDRLKDVEPAYTKHVTPTELFLVSMMVATKFHSGHDDEAPYVNWAECINTTPDSLLEMELCFLNAIDWRVYVSNKDFFDKVKSLETTLAQHQGMKRGFYTYLELSSLVPSVQIARQLIQAILILSFSYTVFVLSMVASVFLVSRIPGTYLNSQTCSTVHTATNLPSENSSTHHQIDEVVNVFSETNKTSETAENHSESDLNVSLNIALSRLSSKFSDPVITREHTNTTFSLFSSLYSILKMNSFQTSVIAKSFNLDYKHKYKHGIIGEKFFSNYSLSRLFPSLPITNGFKFNFNGIQMKWAE